MTMFTGGTDKDRDFTSTYLARGTTEIDFPKEKTALLVIDPVNDFLSEGGAAWELTKGTVRSHNVVENLVRVIEAARVQGIPIMFGPMAYTEDDYAEHELHRRSGINRLMFENKMFIAGSWGADFHPDLQPHNGDIVLLPHKGIDVFETDLPIYLEGRGITHLVITGMTANLCCESTGRHASEAGYDVTFISDAIGSESDRSYEAAIEVNYPLIANVVMTTDEIVDAMNAVGDPTQEYLSHSVQVGDTMRGSDHLEIGEVKEVVSAGSENEAYVLVPRGMIFTSDTYVPMDAVVRRAGRSVFINVPKQLATKMPWDEPPTRQRRAEKLGPRSADIENLYRSRSPSLAGR
jgi:ureidoacrylate peracid hydrolase